MKYQTRDFENQTNNALQSKPETRTPRRLGDSVTNLFRTSVFLVKCFCFYFLFLFFNPVMLFDC